MRILHAWEIGDGRGHTRNMRGLAAHPLLAQYDHAFKTIRADPIDIRPYIKPGQPWQARSFADVLTVMGYGNKRILQRRLDKWRKAIDEARPDVIIAESAPTAILAARGGPRVIAVGTPYGLPLTHLECFPDFNAAGIALLPHDKLPAPREFETHAVVPFCYPSMDMYQAHRRDACTGPLVEIPVMPEVPHATFAYLSAKHPQIKAILAALAALSGPVRAYVDGKRFRSQGNLTILQAFDLVDEMARCTRVVHHAAMGISQAALVAGRAQFAFPYHVENMQNWLKLCAHGTALGAGYAEQDRYAAMLAHPYDDRFYVAQHVARQLPAANAAETVASYLR